MSTGYGEQSTVDLQVADVLQAWLLRRERGGAEDAGELIRQHPELNPALGICIESLALIDSSESLLAESAEAIDPTHFPQIPDFEIRRQIGRGGMGVVYEARQVSLDRLVALKILPAATIDPLAAERFQREAETAAALHHTNIVPIYAVGHTEGIHWYAMQRINGDPLGRLLSEYPAGVDTDELVRIGIEATDALAYAHQNGVIHRDVKPGNLLIEPDGRIWLTDFGLARRDVDATATVTGAMIGTPRYMSPEQVFCHPDTTIDHRSDLYSLGATLYELATGQVLFDGPTPLDVLQQIRMADPPSPRRVRSNLPRDLEIVLQKCLAKEPAERYQKAEDLANDLRAIRDGRPIKARGVPFWTVARRRIQRHRDRFKLALMMVAATAALLLGGLALRHQRQQSLLGGFHATSAGGPYSATLRRVTIDGDVDAPPIVTTFPTQNPLIVPAGDYNISLAGDGRFSESVRAAVSAGEFTKIRYVDHRSPPTEIDIEDKWVRMVHDPDGGQSLTVLGEETFSVYGDGGRQVVRVPVSLIAGDSDEGSADFSYQIDQTFTGNRNAQNPYFAKPDRVMSQSVDLTGNGRGDFVIAARHSPSIAAIDDAGVIIWKTDLQLPADQTIPPLSAKAPSGQPWEFPWVLQMIPIDDINDDQVAEIVISVVRVNPEQAVEPFLVTIDGAGGNVMTTAILPPVLRVGGPGPWPTSGKLSGRSKKTDENRSYIPLLNRGDERVKRNLTTFNGNYNTAWSPRNVYAVLPVTPPVVLAKINDAPVAITVTADSIHSWDLITGERAAPTITMPFTIAASPIRVRLSGTSAPAFFLWAEKGTSQSGMKDRAAVVVLGETKPRWILPVGINWDVMREMQERSDLPLVTDLDGDGSDELIVPLADDFSNWNRSGTKVTCLDASNGRGKWKTATSISCVELAPERACVIPDVNNDGVRDVVVGSITAKWPKHLRGADSQTFQESTCYLDVISGLDGSTLKFFQQPLSRADGDANLLCIDSLQRIDDPNDRTSILMEASVVFGETRELELESVTIRIDLTSSESPVIANGLTRLAAEGNAATSGFYRRRPGRDLLHRDAAVWIADHPKHEILSDGDELLAAWNNASGDGRLLIRERGHQRVRAIDTASGVTLWTLEHLQIVTKAFTIASNHSRPAQILLRMNFGRASNCMLIDGETGQRRWFLAATLAGDLIRVDADQDDPGRFLWVLARTNSPFTRVANPMNGLQLVKVDRGSGKILWEKFILQGLGPSHVNLPNVEFRQLDCDGDGISDIVIPEEGDNTQVALVALRGQNGQRIWKRDVNLLYNDWSAGIHWPLMLSVGTAEQPRIVMMDRDGKQSLAVRMLNGRTGDELDHRVYDVKHDVGKKWVFDFQSAGKTDLKVLKADIPWPSVAAIYCGRGPKRYQRSGVWNQLSTSDKGFTDELNVQQSVGFIAATDIDGDGNAERVMFDGDTLKCFKGEQELWTLATAKDRVGKRVHEVPGYPSLLGMLDEKQRYALIDLAEGREIWRSERPEKDANSRSALTSVTQATTCGLHVIQTLREGVRISAIELEGRDGANRRRPGTTPQLAGNVMSSDVRLMTRMPMSMLWGGHTLTGVIVGMMWDTLLAVTALLLPAAYLLRLIRERRWSIGYLMLAPVVTLIALYAWRVLLDSNRALSVDPNGREPWPIILLSGSMVAAAFGFIVRCVRQRLILQFSIAVGCTLVFASMMVGIPILTQSLSGSAVKYRVSLDDIAAITMMLGLNICAMLYVGLVFGGWLHSKFPSARAFQALKRTVRT